MTCRSRRLVALTVAAGLIAHTTAAAEPTPLDPSSEAATLATPATPDSTAAEDLLPSAEVLIATFGPPLTGGLAHLERDVATVNALWLEATERLHEQLAVHGDTLILAGGSRVLPAEALGRPVAPGAVGRRLLVRGDEARFIDLFTRDAPGLATAVADRLAARRLADTLLTRGFGLPPSYSDEPVGGEPGDPGSELHSCACPFTSEYTHQGDPPAECDVNSWGVSYFVIPGWCTVPGCGFIAKKCRGSMTASVDADGTCATSITRTGTDWSETDHGTGSLSVPQLVHLDCGKTLTVSFSVGGVTLGEVVMRCKMCAQIPPLH